ncbi:hypothetical protein BV22DRAFT_1135037 [Leucogyrophana mollusca]|uniref:Uncharacterized protein n=1 Tax=Leucogyrophana mollusca TaxID=85980 RepID=A0ACB8AY21_9AGAM|nr:hypothetical protein BV22DRAFT_1135037 [Leucogyrophana mollusca]
MSQHDARLVKIGSDFWVVIGPSSVAVPGDARSSQNNGSLVLPSQPWSNRQPEWYHVACHWRPFVPTRMCQPRWFLGCSAEVPHVRSRTNELSLPVEVARVMEDDIADITLVYTQITHQYFRSSRIPKPASIANLNVRKIFVDEGGFYSMIQELKQQVLDCLAFLHWFAAWDAGWIRSLQKGMQIICRRFDIGEGGVQFKGVLVNLWKDWRTINIPLWVAVGVPVCFPWTEAEVAHPRFFQLSPTCLQASALDILPSYLVLKQAMDTEYDEFLQAIRPPKTSSFGLIQGKKATNLWVIDFEGWRRRPINKQEARRFAASWYCHESVDDRYSVHRTFYRYIPRKNAPDCSTSDPFDSENEYHVRERCRFGFSPRPGRYFDEMGVEELEDVGPVSSPSTSAAAPTTPAASALPSALGSTASHTPSHLNSCSAIPLFPSFGGIFTDGRDRRHSASGCTAHDHDNSSTSPLFRVPSSSVIFANGRDHRYSPYAIPRPRGHRNHHSVASAGASVTRASHLLDSLVSALRKDFAHATIEPPVLLDWPGSDMVRNVQWNPLLLKHGVLLLSPRAEVALRYRALANKISSLDILLNRAFLLGIEFNIMVPFDKIHLFKPAYDTISNDIRARPPYFQPEHVELLVPVQLGTLCTATQWETAVRAIFRRPHARAYILKGGLLWRLALEFGSRHILESVANGPSISVTMANHMRREFGPVMDIADDEAVAGEVAVMLGVEHRSNGGNRYMWPPPESGLPCFDGEWNIIAEEWFTHHLARVRAGDVNLKTAGQWKKDIRRGYRKRDQETGGTVEEEKWIAGQRLIASSTRCTWNLRPLRDIELPEVVVAAALSS